jgi:hypothetical protein
MATSEAPAGVAVTLTEAELERLRAAARLVGPLRELVAALDGLLVVYRTGDQRRGAAAADRVGAARDKLRAAEAPAQERGGR